MLYMAHEFWTFYAIAMVIKNCRHKICYPTTVFIISLVWPWWAFYIISILPNILISQTCKGTTHSTSKNYCIPFLHKQQECLLFHHLLKNTNTSSDKCNDDCDKMCFKTHYFTRIHLQSRGLKLTLLTHWLLCQPSPDVISRDTHWLF